MPRSDFNTDNLARLARLISFWSKEPPAVSGYRGKRLAIPTYGSNLVHRTSTTMQEWISALLASLPLVALAWGTASATTLRVPAEFATIQAAIVAARNGDTVLVAPGSYREGINFLGKAIVVQSEAGPQATILDGAFTDVLVTAVSQETTSSVLAGFTLTRALGFVIVMKFRSSLTISGNIIQGNRVCYGGAAISLENGGAPIIKNNIITDNRCDDIVPPGWVAGGRGIEIVSDFDFDPQIVDNVISNHVGVGIYMLFIGNARIAGNTITGNGSTYPFDQGGGIYIAGVDTLAIVNNVITGNVSYSGGGIYMLISSEARGPRLVNNTIADNDSPNGSAIFADGGFAQTLLANNIVVAKAGQTAIECGQSVTGGPILQFNDVFAPSGTRVGGACADQTGTNGNISVDPAFVNPVADFHLQAGSPAINAGTNSASDLPSTDKDGRPRIIDGVVDMGAFEFGAVAASAPIPSLHNEVLILLITLVCALGAISLARRGTSR